MASNESAVLFDQPGPKGRKTIRIVNWIAGIIFAVVVVLILMRLHNPPDGENQLSWELWKPALDAEAWTDFYLPGLWATIRASVLAVVGAVVFGLVFGVGRLLPSLLIRTISGAIVEFARAVPVLLLMIFFWRWFALVIYNGSVVAELVRSGVGNLPNGQREASLALGLTRTQSLLQIEVPQAIYAMLPAAVTQLVVVLKDTALGSIIMYTDLLQESRRLGSMYFNILQTLVVAAVVYFIVCWLLSRLAEWLPSRMQQHTEIPLLYIHAVYIHGAFHSVVEARDQIDQRRFAGTGRADRHHGSVEREPDRRGQGRRAAGWRAACLPCAPSRHQRVHPPVASDQVRPRLR